MKQYKAIFFDWDGTAVLSRQAPVTDVVKPMKLLLSKGIKLVIVSGTTYDRIAGGRLHTYFTASELQNLWLGLGRGAYNYRFDESGLPYVWKDCIPDAEELLQIHDICYELHRILLKRYSFPTDIVFSRPNYCKIDLMVDLNRGEQLFFQENELELLKQSLKEHGITDGLQGLIALAEETAGRYGLTLTATTDAKYLEAGLSSKSDNVNFILEYLQDQYGILPEECSFWGDEYIGLADGIFGSDSYMITQMTSTGDFFDVSEAEGIRPDKVRVLGGGISCFINFLKEQ